MKKALLIAAAVFVTFGAVGTTDAWAGGKRTGQNSMMMWQMIGQQQAAAQAEAEANAMQAEADRTFTRRRERQKASLLTGGGGQGDDDVPLLKSNLGTMG